jgi:hypothetical protein
MAFRGDTIKLKVTLNSFATDTPTDPTTLVLKIYDLNNVLLTTISNALLYKTAVGVYQVPYLVPNVTGFKYEFSGILETYTFNRSEFVEVI